VNVVVIAESRRVTMTRLVPVLKHRYDARTEAECWGYANLRGEIAIAHRFQAARAFHDGMACVKLDGALTYGDEDGSILSERFDGADDFAEGRARVVREKRVGYVDKKGALVVPFQYAYGGSFSEGLAPVQRDGKWGYIDGDGAESIPFQFDDARGFSETFAAVKVGDRWSFIDREGRFATDQRFESAYDFSEGYAAVQVDRRFGYLDKSLSMAIAPRFDRATSFHDGLASVSEIPSSGTSVSVWQFIDASGKRALAIEFKDYFGPIFSEGLLAARMYPGWGYYDKTGAEAIKMARFLDRDGKSFYATSMMACEHFRDGVARVFVQPSYYVDPMKDLAPDHIAYIDKTGAVLIGSRR